MIPKTLRMPSRFTLNILGNNLGNNFFKNPQKLPKSPANGFRASRSFCFVGSMGSEELRSGQKLQNSNFESAAYANFATPAAFNFNSLPEPVPKPIGHVAYGDWLLDTVKLPSPRSA